MQRLRPDVRYAAFVAHDPHGSIERQSGDRARRTRDAAADRKRNGDHIDDDGPRNGGKHARGRDG